MIVSDWSDMTLDGFELMFKVQNSITHVTPFEGASSKSSVSGGGKDGGQWWKKYSDLT